MPSNKVKSSKLILNELDKTELFGSFGTHSLHGATSAAVSSASQILVDLEK